MTDAQKILIKNQSQVYESGIEYGIDHFNKGRLAKTMRCSRKYRTYTRQKEAFCLGMIEGFNSAVRIDKQVRESMVR